MKIAKLMVVSLFSAALAAGCAATEEYEVTGEVSSAQSVSGPITLEFFEVDPDDPDAERVSLKEVTLDALGAFTETIEVTEDYKIIAYAIEDQDGDGACTEGELWAEAEAEPNEDGTIDPITLALQGTACPAE